jgi:antitoxin (DNA-binding transcriptional repressor) of toxin-antitoxin stability system
MAITASDLRQDIYRILDSVLDSGQAVEVERRGRRLKIAPVAAASKLSRLVPRAKFLRGDPDDIVSVDWSDTWRP